MEIKEQLKSNINKVNSIYFIISFIIVSICIYIYHKGFEYIDIINVPLLTIILFFIINYFADTNGNKKLDKYITENYVNNSVAPASSSDLYEKFQNKNENENKNKQDKSKEIKKNANNLYKLFAEDEDENEDVDKDEDVDKKELELVNELKKYENKEKNKKSKNKSNKNKVMQKEMMEEEMMGEEMMGEEMMGEEMMGEEMMGEEMMGEEMMGEEMMEEEMMEEEDMKDMKQEQIKKMNAVKKPDINKHHMKKDIPSGILNNSAKDSISPININVSYNNNRPSSYNDFEGSLSNTQLRSMKDKQDLGRFNFDNGYDNNNFLLPQPKKKATASSKTNNLMNPVNEFTQNKALSKMNNKYFPAYLENQKNKNENPMNVYNTDNSKKDRTIYSEESDTVVNPNQWQNTGGLANRTKHSKNKKQVGDSLLKVEPITTNPITLNGVWSEYAPSNI